MQQIPKPTWQPDWQASSCTSCSIDFSLFIRKHHCRNCGKIFCDSCSQYKMNLFHLGYSTQQRVCKICINSTNNQNNNNQMIHNQYNQPQNYNPQMDPNQYAQISHNQNMPPQPMYSNQPYNPQYNQPPPHNMPIQNMSVEGGNILTNSQFFKCAMDHNEREFIVILDQSGSMSNSDGHHHNRWEHAEESLISKNLKEKFLLIS
eukprot:TRINITY_DN1102_c0_g1_i1.p1 TRINITY_DN1102_c0_g1~~TRINITY_DN1102_c0_g1_i1.p1  ORF type:complete len:204 (+),score=24.33 TRINITY_DN1102_c0_g1_i1:19-630(+)